MTQRETVSVAEFAVLTRPLIGLPVARPWRGYGTALFLELGELTRKYPRTGHSKGEAGIMIEWSWRVERTRSIAFGSSNSDRTIATNIQRLFGLRVCELTTEGRLPELRVGFDHGTWLRSFMTTQGQPEWTVFLQDGTWLHVKNGGIRRDWPNQRSHRTIAPRRVNVR